MIHSLGIFLAAFFGALALAGLLNTDEWNTQTVYCQFWSTFLFALGLTLALS